MAFRSTAAQREPVDDFVPYDVSDTLRAERAWHVIDGDYIIAEEYEIRDRASGKTRIVRIDYGDD